ncbi:MAG: DUF58 domain-containing protein [Woeseia sp.]|nr:DUF58 domain-containing protein [Woeseia sp.]
MLRVSSITPDSPVNISQAGLIRLSGPARAIALDVLRVNSLQTGAYVSHFKGRGMEFDESRPYQPGDDPRSIDWRVTARSSEAYTKLFREERERPVLIMTDLRATMHFATKGCFKSVNAARAAALLAWAAHHRGDRLGGIVFGDSRHRELKPRLGRQAALRYLHELVTHPDWAVNAAPDVAQEEPSLTQAIAMLKRVTHPGSMVIIISDFVGLSRTAQSYMTGIARHNEILAIFLSDPLERQLPPPGRYRLVNDEDEMDIDTYAKAARLEYRQAFKDRLQDFEIFCHRYGIHLLSLATDDDPVRFLQQALGKRTR